MFQSIIQFFFTNFVTTNLIEEVYEVAEWLRVHPDELKEFYETPCEAQSEISCLTLECFFPRLALFKCAYFAEFYFEGAKNGAAASQHNLATILASMPRMHLNFSNVEVLYFSVIKFTNDAEKYHTAQLSHAYFWYKKALENGYVSTEADLWTELKCFVDNDYQYEALGYRADASRPDQLTLQGFRNAYPFLYKSCPILKADSQEYTKFMFDDGGGAAQYTVDNMGNILKMLGKNHSSDTTHQGEEL